MFVDLTDICLEIRGLPGNVLKQNSRKPLQQDLHPSVWQLDQLENFADCSNGKEILGLRIFEIRVTQTHAPDKTIFQ